MRGPSARLRASRFCWAGRHGEQFARLGDVDGAVAAGEQAVMADAVEALWQYVHQEAPNELVGVSVMVL